MEAITQEFKDALAEVSRLHYIKLRWLVPPLKSLSLGQGYRLVQGASLREEGFNFTGYNNWQSSGQSQTGEPIYKGKVVIVSPMAYLRLPSHLAEMARVDKFASMCGTTRDNPKGLSPDPAIPVMVENVSPFVGAWSGRDAWSGILTEDRWLGWMYGSANELDFYKDGSIVRYSGGMRGGEYWNWPLKFDATKGRNYYDPKINPRSSDDVEAILKGLASGKISNQPTSVSPLTPTPSPVPQPNLKPTKSTGAPAAKPRPRTINSRNSVVPVSKIRRKR